jgi:nucleoside-diphosphate-sugar epimerase
MPRRVQARKLSVEHIQRRVSRALRQGIVYDSIEELLRDEILEEEKIPLYERKRRRRRRLAITNAEGEVGGEVVGSLAAEEFDLIAIVREFQHAMHILEIVSHALHLGGRHKKQEAKVKIVRDDFSDEERLASVLARVSQVLHLSAPVQKGAAPDVTLREGVKPAIAVAGACRRAGVDRLIFASSEGHLSGAPKPGEGAAASAPKMLSEEAVKVSGIPYVLARFPTVYSSASFSSLLAQAKGKAALLAEDRKMNLMHVEDMAAAFSKILRHPKVQNQEMNFMGESLTRGECCEAISRQLVGASLAAGAGLKKDDFFARTVGPVPLQSKPPGQASADARKIRRLVGFSPSKNFSKGVREYLAARASSGAP